MQLDFTDISQSPDWSYCCGWLEKRGSVRKNWKTRYFYLHQGKLRYYAKGPTNNSREKQGSDMRGEISLLGADVSIFEQTQLHLTLLQGDRKTIFHLRAHDNKEANTWHISLTKDIQIQNIQALRQSCRIPEVVEWYYQYQSELSRKFAFLTNVTEVNLHYSVGSGRESNDSVSSFNVCLNQERGGLVLSMVATGKKFNRIESINNGRIILLSDITGAIIPPEGWVLNSMSKFRFTLITREDELEMEMDPVGVTWLQGVRDMAIFMKLPKPSARSNIYVPPRTTNTTMNSLIEFSANSGVVFACSSDIPLIINGFDQVVGKSPMIVEIGNRFQLILKLIPELKSNKEAALNFGERIEEIVRVLGDGDVGILHQCRENDKSLLNFHLSTLHGKLQDIINYLTVQSRSGWLLASVMTSTSIYSGSNNESAKYKFEYFDNELMSIINALIKAISGPNSNLVLFEKKEYAMAVDVKKSIEALGGIEAIYHDGAKERALARLIQADGHDIHNELIEFIRMTSNGSENRESRSSRSSFSGFILGKNNGPRNSAAASDRSSFSSYQTSVDYSSDEGAGNSVLRYICCCIPKRSTGKRLNKKGNIQLEEPLVQ